jgi:hypothetical protein
MDDKSQKSIKVFKGRERERERERERGMNDYN